MTAPMESLSAKADRLEGEFDIQLQDAERLARSDAEVLTQEIWDALAPALAALATAVQEADASQVDEDEDYDSLSFNRGDLQGRIDVIQSEIGVVKPKTEPSSQGQQAGSSTQQGQQAGSSIQQGTYTYSTTCKLVTAAAVVLFACYMAPSSEWWNTSLIR